MHGFKIQIVTTTALELHCIPLWNSLIRKVKTIVAVKRKKSTSG